MNRATLVIKIIASEDRTVEISPKGLGLVTVFKKGETLCIHIANGYVTNQFFYGILLDKKLAKAKHILKVPLENCKEDSTLSSESSSCLAVEVEDKIDFDSNNPIQFIDDKDDNYKSHILANIRKINKA